MDALRPRWSIAGSRWFGSNRWRLAPCLVAALALASVPHAVASTTIGQLAPGTSPSAFCNSGPVDFIPGIAIDGNSYVVPPGGGTITSWSTNAASGIGQTLTMKVFRRIAEPATFLVVGHDGPRELVGSAVNTFPVHIAVKANDLIGLNAENAGTINNACLFTSSVGDSHLFRMGGLEDQASGAFTTVNTAVRLNVSAQLEPKPSNAFKFGRLKRNSTTGTATLTVSVPGPGQLELDGKGLITQRRGGLAVAVASKTVSVAGAVKLRIRARGSKRKRLHKTGKVNVKAYVTFTPTDGDSNTHSRKLTLRKI